MNVKYPSTIERFLYALMTLFFAACACCGLGACKKVDKPNITDWAQICVHNDVKSPSTEPVYVRTSDQSCETTQSPTANPRFFWLYINQAESGFMKIPGAGQQLPGSRQPDKVFSTTTERPNVDVIGRVPYAGGLGTATP